jgi:Tfp pilus assembly protein PilE
MNMAGYRPRISPVGSKAADQGAGRRSRFGARGVRGTSRSDRAGFTIIECLVYSMVLLILLGCAYAAFYRCVENSVRLRRSTDDIANALHAGERWRADVRTVNGPIRFEIMDGQRVLQLPGEQGQVAYLYTTNVILRRAGHGAWTCLLNNVAASEMESDPRPNVGAWRWELELKPRSRKPAPVRPLFTFLAVPEASSKP